MPIDSQGNLENGEELTNEDLINIKDQLLEATQAKQEVQTTEDTATAVEQPVTQGSENNEQDKQPVWRANYAEGETHADTKLYQITSAPSQGVVDTITDAYNMAAGLVPYGNKIQIPKVKPYESKTAQAIRNISGLVIPSLGLRSMLIKGATKLHLAGKAAPWLQRLGNRQSFAYLAKFGADIGTGATVDYVAEQNKVDDNLFGTLKKYWPRTYQFIPETWATNDGDSPDVKRSKNVNEGAILGLMSSVVEGVAYITKAGRSLDRVTKLTSENPQLQKKLDDLSKDEFSDVTFSENPIEDTIIRNAARREKELDNLGEYFKRTDPNNKNPILGVDDVFDPTESATRTKDPDGILGAAVDAARIAKNVDTSYGRLGSVVSEASLKYGLEVDNRTQEVLIKSLVQEIKNGGRYSAELASGKKLTFDEIDEAGTRLSEILTDPRMSPGDMKKLLDETKKTLEDGVNKVVGKEGYNAVTKTIKSLKDELLDLDVKKARAYLATSLAGQVSDIAEGVRLMDDNMVMERAIDQIADRLEYLLVEKGIAAYDAGSTLAFMKTWKNASNTKDAKVMKLAGDAYLGERNQQMLDLIPDAKNYAQTLRETAKTNPDFLRSLMLANELTDGDISSMYQLNKMVSEKLSVFKKAIVDGNPDVAPIINRAWWSNVYNSTLSSFATPIKALQGNLGGLTARPMATLIGAGLSGDWSEIRKAHYTYFSLDDTLINATKHMGKVYKKVATDPSQVSYVMREDIANKVADELEVLQKYAQAAEKNGEYGPQALVTLYENLQAMGDDPWLRFGANSMTAMDGFSRSVVASTEAKSRAFNQLVKDGKDFSKKNLDELSEKIRQSMFDQEGMIDDAGVNYLNSEIALNLDSNTVKGLNELVNRYPVFKPFLLFPRTSANIIDTFGKYSPMGILSNDYKKMWGTFGNKKITDFGPEEIKEILESRGQVFDETYLQKFRTIRHEVKGKVAMGTVFTMLAVNAAIGGRIHGNGHYNKARQRVRDSLNWKRRSYKIPGTDTWASGDILGPLGDWMFTVADVVDNFDLMSEKGIENALQKLVYVFASAITSRSVLSNLEPMNDIFQGNGFAFNRWAASFGNNAMGPLGGFRNEIGRVINPALRQMKGGMLEGWRNRNAWLDIFDPQGALPEKFDPIDGNKIGYPEDIWMRFANTYSPMKFSESISPEKQFLVDIEYDLLTKVNRSIGGAELTEKEKSLIFSKMGELGTYKKEINKIMKDASNIVYKSERYPELDGIKGFINIVKAARKMGLSSEDLPSEKFKGVNDRLDRAFSAAKRQAELNLDSDILSEIKKREYKERVKKHYVQEGNVEKTLEQTLIPTR